MSISQTEAACLLSKRTDILPFYAQNGWDTSTGNYVAIVENWWAMSHSDSAHQQYTTLGDYLVGLGCRMAPTPAPPSSPGPYGAVGDEWFLNQILVWARDNPILAAGLLGLTIYTLLGGKR